MPSSPSAKKRVRQNEKKRLLNRARKNALRTQVKRLVKAVEAKSEDTAKAFVATQKRLDRMASKGVVHKNTAARRKSRLAHRINAAKAAAAAAPAETKK